MWAWWMIFLLFAGAMGYFVMWYLMSSNKFNFKYNQSEKLLKDPRKDKKSKFTAPPPQNTESSIVHKLEEIEFKVNQYSNRQYEILMKLEKVQSALGNSSSLRMNDDGGEWEEMYYEMRDRKEELEEEIEKLVPNSPAQQKEETQARKAKAKGTALPEKGEMPDIERESLQDVIHLQQKKLEALQIREMVLEKELAEKNIQLDALRTLKMQNADMLSQVEELKSFVDTLGKRNAMLDSRKNNIAELQYQLHSKNHETEDFRSRVNEIIKENEHLVKKIIDLQEKLREETFTIERGSKN